MKRLLASATVAIGLAAFGQAAEVAHPDAAVEKRLRGLGEELRCLVCQNQTIADSSAPLAVDLRNQIRGQIAQGRSDDQIRGYMVERYGDFVLYSPPFRATTALLWLGPFLLIAGGLGVFILVLRRRKVAPQAASEVSAERRDQIAALLESEAREGGKPAAPASGKPGAKKKGGRSGRP